MTTIGARLETALKAAGHQIIGVSIGDYANKATWKVNPPSLQAACQALIDAFDPDATAVIDLELDAEVKALMDNERLFSAIVWTIIDTYSPPATIPKYTTARTKVIAAYKTRPWIP